eukprot:GHVU01017427.1.p1 GENE.GHVU01017427.1~~GHVU01017427.1.p1  ORF type:complete len:214 (+),score=16.18 GHVU01017427.1:165-806(+)
MAPELPKTNAEWKQRIADEASYKILREKDTESAFSGEYDKFYPVKGHFKCKACSAPLYSAQAKFDSGCGWPSFDQYYEGSCVIPPASLNLSSASTEIGKYGAGGDMHPVSLRVCDVILCVSVGVCQLGTSVTRSRFPRFCFDGSRPLYSREAQNRNHLRQLQLAPRPRLQRRETENDERHCVNSLSVIYDESDGPNAKQITYRSTLGDSSSSK